MMVIGKLSDGRDFTQDRMIVIIKASDGGDFKDRMMVIGKLSDGRDFTEDGMMVIIWQVTEILEKTEWWLSAS